MIDFVVTALLGVLWLHYASRWFRFGPPTWMSTLVAVIVAQTLFLAGSVSLITHPLFAAWPIDAIALPVCFVVLAGCLKLFLEDRVSRQRPRWKPAVGLAATTTAMLGGFRLASSFVSHVEGS